ncbi:hypothetical protein [Anaeromyxobacter dehalogenans]|uniref:DUF3352 domain-containing protein n=1 Tax=Anaeromyxobacter dehalogenans (strain 2CP-C) TaxID=290397 RepID=Q2IG46_ANADE|nr:hypothetical protein [Anaeromyxobacter dehalogenans]ABC83552.1 hypothetical protein Adeh_3786 [Anaeromyxobacter dehalogenans 2CP-C]
MLRRLLLPALLAVALGAGGCRGRSPGPPPERFVPAAARAVVVVPETGRASRELAALHATVSAFPGAAAVAEARGAIAAQLGFDPLDRKGLAEAGVDARRGAALALLGADGEPSRALLVLPVGDAARLETLLARLARERLGAELRTAEPRGTFSTVAFRRAAGEPIALAYLVTQRTALVSQGPGAADLVAEAAGLAPERALAGSAAFAAARRALGDAPAALAFAPPGSPLVARAWPVRDGLALGLAAGPGGLHASAAVLLGAREPSFRALAGGGAAAALLAHLHPEAQLAARWDGEPGPLGGKLVPMLSRADRARLAARGLDPQRDLFDLLAPGAAVALSLSPGLELAGLTEATLRADPLRLVRLEAVARVKDPDRARAAFDRLAPPPRRPRAARPAAAPPAPGTWRIATPSGELAWRLDGDRLAVAGGAPGALDALAARLDGDGAGFRAPTPAAEAALKGGLGGAVLDAQRLVAGVRALPEDAFGTGPSGFVVRSVVDRFLEPAARLSAVSLRAQLAEGALVLVAEVEVLPSAPEVRP